MMFFLFYKQYKKIRGIPFCYSLKRVTLKTWKIVITVTILLPKCVFFCSQEQKTISKNTNQTNPISF